MPVSDAAQRFLEDGPVDVLPELPDIEYEALPEFVDVELVVLPVLLDVDSDVVFEFLR